jgi:hypothetical protein
MTDIDQELAALYRGARAQEAPTRADRMAVQAAVAAALATTAAATSAQAAGGVATSQLVKAVTAGKSRSGYAQAPRSVASRLRLPGC